MNELENIQRRERRNNRIKNFALVFVLLDIALYMLVPIGSVSSLLWIFVWPFFHASPFHMLANLFCFLSAVFLWKVEWKELVWAYLTCLVWSFIYEDVTSCQLHDLCGLSGLLYAIFLQHTPLKEKQFIIFFPEIVFSWLVTFLFVPSVSTITHIFCYFACGIIIAAGYLLILGYVAFSTLLIMIINKIFIK